MIFLMTGFMVTMLKNYDLESMIGEKITHYQSLLRPGGNHCDCPQKRKEKPPR
jgi:hypothetical protein